MSYTKITVTNTQSGAEKRSVRYVRGSKARIYKHEPNGVIIAARTVWVPNIIRYGPRTDDVEIRGISRMFGATDVSNNYMYDPELNAEAFDAVSTLVMVQRVMTMVRRSLWRSGNKEGLAWFWGRRPIQVWPWAGDMVNAFYQRDDKALIFFYFKEERKDKTMYTCRSWDIVAHETGHAILDAIHPQWLLDSTDSLQTGAINEAFADLMAIFGHFEQLDMCETVISECRGHLSGPSNLMSCLGEEFGAACGLPFGIRNVQEDVTMSNATYNIHDLSRVITGAVYDSLVKIYEHESNLYAEDPSETLHRSAKSLLDTLLRAIMDCPESKPTFSDLAEKMLEHAPNREHKMFLQEEFERRYILNALKHSGRIKGGLEASVRSLSLATSYPKTKIRSYDPYCCGTLLAARDDSVKAEVKKALSALSARIGDEEKPEDNIERFEAGSGATLVHVPWAVP